jgi:hypothetical protein
MSRRLRERVGAGPVALLGLLFCAAVAAAAFGGWLERPHDLLRVLIWFAVAIVGHDLVLMPLYTAIDRVTIVALHRRAVRAGLPGPAPYLRIPALIAALLFLVHLPVLLHEGASSELAASGIPEHGYLLRWVLLTAVLFAAGALGYGRAVARARRARWVTPTKAQR